MGRLFRRSACECVCAGRDDRQTAVEDAREQSSGGHNHGSARAVCGAALCACIVIRGGGCSGPWLLLLPIPRQRNSCGCRLRQNHLDVLHHSRRTEANTQEPERSTALRTFGRRSLEFAHDRRGEESDLRDDRGTVIPIHLRGRRTRFWLWISKPERFCGRGRRPKAMPSTLHAGILR